MRKRQETAEFLILKREFEKGEELHVHQVASLLSLSIRNAREYLNLLHSLKVIYVVEYVKYNRGPALPVFSLRDAEQDDVPYYSPLGNTVTTRIRRKKLQYASLFRCNA